MTTSPRGEVGFEAGGVRYTLLFDVNTLIEMEDEFDLDPALIVARVAGSGRAKFLRDVLRFGLKAKHGDVPALEVGLIMTDLTVTESRAKVLEALVRAFPKPAGAGASDEDPPIEGAAGIGAASSEPGAVSA
jgi:hypothetical protein